MNGAFTYGDIKKMCLAEFFEWQKIAIDYQKEENRRYEQEVIKQKFIRGYR